MSLATAAKMLLVQLHCGTLTVNRQCLLATVVLAFLLKSILVKQRKCFWRKYTPVICLTACGASEEYAKVLGACAHDVEKCMNGSLK